MTKYKKILLLFILFISVVCILAIAFESLGFWNVVISIGFHLIFSFGLIKFAVWLLCQEKKDWLSNICQS